ncbi:hypothetical protein Q9L58_009556 [Maublancomyces gigas]|uniref:Uncharacterized protein n=1 Tax=Discina gigas TaxID=1032678 RepID=A0ABR3G6I5_9PEZI
MSFHLYHDSSLEFSAPPSPAARPELTLSPDLLAAVGNITIGKRIAPQHRSSLLPDHACHPINGLTSNSVTSVRTFKVLDALASLAVSRQEGQVISIGLQLDMDAKTIILTIAENDPVTLETTLYVGTTWALLRDLSKVYANHRAGHTDAEAWRDWGGQSPPVPNHLTPAERIIGRLAQHVYTFTENKFRRRVNRWWPRLRMFTNAFIRAKNHNLNEMESLLRVAVLSFRIGLDALDAKNDQFCVNWNEVVDLMNSAATAATKLLDNRYHLETWTNDMKADFALRRALEKVTSHHRYFTELVGFAHSPRLHRFFSLQPSIASVPDSFDSVPRYVLPDTQPAWLALLQDICANAPELIEKPALLAKVSATLHDKISGDDQDPYVHSECALVAHYELHRGRGGTVGANGAELLHAWLPREVESGWRAPNLGSVDDDVWDTGNTEVLQKLMADVLVARLKAAHGIRSGSDSTDASGNTVYAKNEAKERALAERMDQYVGTDI